jgi:hypothetical protein
MHLFYLHGFASSAHSFKARWLAERLAEHGLRLHCPDLNEPDFSTLTVTRMIDRVDSALRELPSGPVGLIGSSLGGFVAVHLAARHRRGAAYPVERLILLAPAVEFPRDCERWLGPEQMARWRATGRVEVFHHGYDEMRPVGFQLYEDASRYDAFATDIEAPILIFQGRADESVDAASVERFARGRPNATLRLLDDGHQLLESLEVIWRGIAEGLGVPTPAGNPPSSS